MPGVVISMTVLSKKKKTRNYNWWDHPGSRPPCRLLGSEHWGVVGEFGPAQRAVWLCKTSAPPKFIAFFPPLVLHVHCITWELVVLEPGSGGGGV